MGVFDKFDPTVTILVLKLSHELKCKRKAVADEIEKKINLLEMNQKQLNISNLVLKFPKDLVSC